ncbi:MAG: DMT family transporter [Thermoanaerobaculia bacterium]
MADLLVLLAIAAVAGIAVALQGQFMGIMDRAAGTVTSVFVTYGLGGIGAVLIWLLRREPLAPVRSVPPYAFLAGGLGLVIVGALGYTAPRLGLTRTIVVMVAAQLLAAVIIDHFGLFTAVQRPLDAGRAFGFLLTVAGVWLTLR